MAINRSTLGVAASENTAGVVGLAEAVAELEGISDRTRDLSPVTEVLAQDLRTLIDDSFDESRTPDGLPWAPLADSTRRKRRRKNGKPLIDTGRLRNSIAVEALPRAIAFGTNTAYAPPQQFGSPKTHLRGRAFLPVTPAGEFMQGGPSGAWLAQAENAIADYLETGVVPA